jgi:hypothetical protein
MIEENKIKRGLNIYLYYWTIPVFIFFILLNYYSRNFKVTFENIGLMISVLSFLFGFLVNINFSMIQSRVNSLKTDLAAETGRLITLFDLSERLGNKFHDKIKNLIDEYTINTLRDYSNYQVGRDTFYKMNKNLEDMEIKTDFQKMNAGSFLSNLSDWEQIRERLEYSTGRGTEWSLKFAAFLLGTFLIGLLFLNRADTFTNILFIILSTVIVFIFLIIEDYDDLRIGDYAMNISNSEQIFDLIGTERYYPEDILKRVKLENGRTYRVGIYDKKEKKEKIVRITYSPDFNLKLAKITNRFWKKEKSSK